MTAKYFRDPAGRYLVICGHYPSREVGDLIDGEMGGSNRIRCMTADPPYGNILKSKWELDRPKGNGRSRVMVRRASNTVDLYVAIAKEARKELSPRGSLLMWGGIGRPRERYFFDAVLAIEDQTPFQMTNLITWKKKRAYGGQKNYLFVREELAWFVLDSKEPAIFNVPLLKELRAHPGQNKKYPPLHAHKRVTNVWTDITELLSGKVHDAEKPVELYMRLYRTHANKGDTVLDVCAGSGVAGVAALRTGRRVILVEEVEETYLKIVNRMKHEDIEEDEVANG